MKDRKSMQRSLIQEGYHQLFMLLRTPDPIVLSGEQLIDEIIDDIDAAFDNGVNITSLYLAVTAKSGLNMSYIEFRRLLRLSRKKKAQKR